MVLYNTLLLPLTVHPLPKLTFAEHNVTAYIRILCSVYFFFFVWMETQGLRVTYSIDVCQRGRFASFTMILVFLVYFPRLGVWVENSESES